MIEPRQLVQRVRSEPFKPFRLLLADGTRIGVPIPQMLVSHDKALVVTKWRRSPRGFPIALDWRTIPLAMIDRIEDLKRPRQTPLKH